MPHISQVAVEWLAIWNSRDLELLNVLLQIGHCAPVINSLRIDAFNY